MPERARLRPIAAARLGAVAAVACALAPLLVWHRSGTVERSGVGLARSADRLDLVEGAVATAVLEAWRALPLLAALSLAFTFGSRTRPAGAVAALAGALSLAAAAVALVAVPGARPLGPLVALGTGLVALLAGTAALRPGEGTGPVEG